MKCDDIIQFLNIRRAVHIPGQKIVITFVEGLFKLALMATSAVLSGACCHCIPRLADEFELENGGIQPSFKNSKNNLVRCDLSQADAISLRQLQLPG